MEGHLAVQCVNASVFTIAAVGQLYQPVMEQSAPSTNQNGASGTGKY